MLRNSNATIIPMNATYNPMNYNVKKERKCSMCQNTGHTIRTCNDITARNTMHEKERNFTRIMKISLLTSCFEEYHNYVDELKSLPKNLFKFYLIQYGGLSSGLTTKLQLFSMFMFKMISRFISHEYVFMETVSRMKVLILNAERSYWLYLSAGNSIRLAENIYNQRVTEITNEYCSGIIDLSKFPIKINRVNDLTEHEHTDDSFECNICYESKNKDTKVIFDCGHSFCGTCVQKTFEICKTSSKNPNCAMCRKEYTSINVVSNNLCLELQQFCDE